MASAAALAAAFAGGAGAGEVRAGGAPTPDASRVPAFAKRPAAERLGEGARITFAISAPTDVKVAVSAANGSLVPHCHNWHLLNFYPDTVKARGRSMSNASMPVVDASDRLYWIVAGGRLCAVDADGSIPHETLLSEPLFPAFKNTGVRTALADSSDGESLYATSIQADDRWGKNARRSLASSV